ncbi:MAG: hypothetical protein IKN54_04235, partial [Lachnospiraceae bacterium]|nr:hypothetical protein [Lachnospiraceae bacterium]
MARSFSKKEAVKITGKHKALINDLEKLVSATGEYEDIISEDIDEMIEYEVRNILKDIPVEELNRDKSGLRIKNLRDEGYANIADILQADKNKIEAVNGISADGAFTIMNMAKEIKKKASQGIKIRINADSKTEASTRLVLSVYQYRKSVVLAKEADELLSGYGQQITKAIDELQPATGTIKWLFTSGTGKHTAELAYAKLEGLLRAGYGIRGNQICDEFVDLHNEPYEHAWKDFEKNSID